MADDEGTALEGVKGAMASPSLGAEEIDRWRRNIRKNVAINYCLHMGIALLEQGQPEEALRFLCQEAPDAEHDGVVTVAACEVLDRCDRGDEARHLLADLRTRDPRAELNGLAALSALYAGSRIATSAATYRLFDRAIAVARQLGDTAVEATLCLERILYENDQGPPVNVDVIARAFLSLEPSDGETGRRCLALLVNFIKGLDPTGTVPTALLPLWQKILDLAHALPNDQRPEAVFPDWQMLRLLGTPERVGTIAELGRLALSSVGDWKAARVLVTKLARMTGNLLGDLGVAAELWGALLDWEPSNVGVRANAALSLVGIGNVERASLLLASDAVPASDGTESGALVRALTAVGAVDQAETVARDALSAFPDDIGKTLDLALALQACGADAEALSLLEGVSSFSSGCTSTLAVLLTAQYFVLARDSEAFAVIDLATEPPVSDVILLLWRGVRLSRANLHSEGRALILAACAQLGEARLRVHFHTLPRAVDAVREELEGVSQLLPPHSLCDRAG